MGDKHCCYIGEGKVNNLKWNVRSIDALVERLKSCRKPATVIPTVHENCLNELLMDLKRNIAHRAIFYALF